MMKPLSAIVLVLTSVYLFTLPDWFAQVCGASLAAIGFILLASFLTEGKRKRKPQFMTASEIEDELRYHQEYIMELDEEDLDDSQFSEADEIIYAQIYERIDLLEQYVEESKTA